MIEKLYRLEEEEIEILEKIKWTYGLPSETAAIRYIIRNFERPEKSENGIQLAILRKIEENTTLMLDVANTELLKKKDEICYPVSMAESPVIEKARKIYKKDVANEKQKKDYRNKKHKS